MFGKLRSIGSSKSITSSSSASSSSSVSKSAPTGSAPIDTSTSGAGAVVVEDSAAAIDTHAVTSLDKNNNGSGSGSGEGKGTTVSAALIGSSSSNADALPTSDSAPTPVASSAVESTPHSTASTVLTTSAGSAVTGVSGSITGATKRSSLFQSAPLKKSGGSSSLSSPSASSAPEASNSDKHSSTTTSTFTSAGSSSSSSSSAPTSSRNENKLVSSSTSSMDGQLDAEKRRVEAAEQRVVLADAKIANLSAQLLEATTALNKVTEARNLERTLHQNDDIYREQLAKEQAKAKEDISRLVSRVASLQNELSKVQAANGRQTSSNTDLVNQLEHVKSRLVTVEAQAAEASELKLKLSKSTELNDKLNADLQSANEERALAESLLATARSKAEAAVSIPLAEALERLDEAEKRSAQHVLEVEGLKKKLQEASKAESEIFAARKSLHHSAEVMSRAHSIEAEAKASLLPLTSEIENLRAVNNALSRDNASLSSSEARLKMMNAEANIKVKQAEAARYEAASVSEKLRSDLLLYSSQMQTLQTELTAARLTIALAEEREAAAVTLQQQTLHQAQQHLRSPKKEGGAQSLLSPGPDGHKKMSAALDPPSPTLNGNSSVSIPGTPSATDRGAETSAIKSAASRFPSLAALAAPPPPHPSNSSSSYAPPTIPAGLTTPSRVKSSKPSLSVVSTPGGSNSMQISLSSSTSNSATAAHNATVAALQRASAMVSDTRSQLRAESDECARLRSVIISLKAKVFANRLDALGKVRIRYSMKKWAEEVKHAKERESILSLKDRAAAVVARMHTRSLAQAKSQSLRNAFSALLQEAKKQKALSRVMASTRRRVLRRALSHWTRGALVFEARRAVVAAATDMKDQASVIISAARTALENTRSENSKLEKALLASHQQLRDVEGGGAAINAEVLLLRSQASDRTHEIERLTTELLNLRESLVRAELVHEGLTRDKTALTERLENEFNARAEAESNLRSSTLREEALVLKMSATEATITQLRDQLLLLSAERSALEKTKSSLNDALLSIQQETSEAKTRRDELELQIGYRLKERDAALASERATAAALLDSRAETAEARAHAASANEASAAMSLTLDQLKKENETLLESFHQTRLANSRLEDRISGLLLSLGADADRLRSAKLDLQALDSRCSTAEARAESLLASLSSCQEELRVCREENRLNAQAASNEARKAAASENELKALSAQLAKAMTSDTSHIGERNSARADMLAKEAHLADSKAQIQVLEATVTKLRSMIEYLTKERDDARTDLNSTSSALALARSHFESAEAAHAETFRLMEKRVVDEGIASARRESEAREASAQLLAIVRDDMAKEIERVRLSHSIEIERVQSMHSVEIASLKSEVMSATSLARAEAAAKENKLIAEIYEAQKIAQQAKTDAKALIDKNMAETAMIREQLQKDREEVAEAKRIAERDVAEVVAVGSESSMRINALTARVKSLTEQRGKVDEEVYKLQIEKKELKNQLSDMQSKVERSERDQKKAALAISQAQALREQVMKEKDEFQKTLNSVKNENNAKNNSAASEEEIKALREKCASLQEKVDQLQSASSQTTTTTSGSAPASAAKTVSTSSAPTSSSASVSSSNTKSPMTMAGGKGGSFSNSKLSSPVVGSTNSTKTNLDEPVAATAASPSPSFAAAPVEIKPGPKPGGPKPASASATGGGKPTWKDLPPSASSSPAASGGSGGSEMKNTPLSPNKVGVSSKFGGSSTSASSSASFSKPNSIGGLSSSSSPSSSSSSSSSSTASSSKASFSGGSGGVKSFSNTALKSSTQGGSASSPSTSSPNGSSFSSKLKSSNASASTPSSNTSSTTTSSTSADSQVANETSAVENVLETNVSEKAVESTTSTFPAVVVEEVKKESEKKAEEVITPASSSQESVSALRATTSAQEEEEKRKKDEEEKVASLAAAATAATAEEQAKKAETKALEEAKRKAEEKEKEEEEERKAKQKLEAEAEAKEKAEKEAAVKAAEAEEEARKKKLEDEKAIASAASAAESVPASSVKKAQKDESEDESDDDDDDSDEESETDSSDEDD